MTDSAKSFLDELKQRKVVRVALAYVISAWIALQFLDLVFENVGAPEWVMQVVMAILAVGFPIALVLAWALEITADGIKATPKKSRAFNAFIAVISIAVITHIAWSFLGSGPADSSSDTNTETADLRVIDSIAVLPFESFSENASDEYFADGLSDTLLHKLAQLPNLKVIARNSSFQFKGSNRDAREIGEILDVATLLEGSVQRQGDQVRIIAQLIDTVDGRHIWSSTFDDTMKNIFELQDRVAEEIMLQLRISISEQDRRRVLRNGTDNPEAYDLLMRANEAPDTISREVFDPENDEQLLLIDRALALDPGYAQAWRARADRFNSALFMSADPTRDAEYAAEAIAAAERAIDADPQYAGGYVELGDAYRRSGDSATAERYLLKALELQPTNSNALTILGLIELREDAQKALELFTQVRELDPQTAFVYRQMSFALNRLGRRDEAVAAIQEGIDRFPNSEILLTDMAVVWINRGRPDEAARWASKVLQQDQMSIFGQTLMSQIWLGVGDSARAGAWAALYEKRFPNAPITHRTKADIEMLSGNTAAARLALQSMPEEEFDFGWLERMAGICMVSGDSDCLLEQAAAMQAGIEKREEDQSPYRFRDHRMVNISILRNAAVSDVEQRDREELTRMLELTADWPIKGGTLGRNAGYRRVMLHALLGDTERAVVELAKTLEFDETGFLESDQFDLHPDKNPLINGLQGSPAYADWLREFTERRESARANLVRMERDKEIIAASTIAML